MSKILHQQYKGSFTKYLKFESFKNDLRYKFYAYHDTTSLMLIHEKVKRKSFMND